MAWPEPKILLRRAVGASISLSSGSMPQSSPDASPEDADRAFDISPRFSPHSPTGEPFKALGLQPNVASTSSATPREQASCSRKWKKEAATESPNRPKT